MLLLYRFLIALLLPIAMPVLALGDRLRGKSRPSWRSRFFIPDPRIDRTDLWIHAVSVGEVELAGRLVTEILTLRPQSKILLTATTATGLALAERRLADRCAISVCPVDLPGPLRRLIRSARPEILALIETELWPEMLHQAGKAGMKTVIINARLSGKSFERYRKIRFFLGPLLEPLSLILARDRNDAGRFEDLGLPPDRIRASGNLKYDLQRDETPLPWAGELLDRAGGRPVIVAGSTLEGEESLLLDALAELKDLDPLLILAPRHPERFDSTADLLRSRKVVFERRGVGGGQSPAPEVFLLDTIGELARAYALGSLAFIGGSLVSRGGHNPLEPLLWGVPVLSGPSVENFEEIYEKMVSAGAVRTVRDSGELASAVRAWISDPEAARRSGAAGLEIIEKNRGATRRAALEILGLRDGT